MKRLFGFVALLNVIQCSNRDTFATPPSSYYLSSGTVPNSPEYENGRFDEDAKIIGSEDAKIMDDFVAGRIDQWTMTDFFVAYEIIFKANSFITINDIAEAFAKHFTQKYFYIHPKFRARANSIWNDTFLISTNNTARITGGDNDIKFVGGHDDAKDFELFLNLAQFYDEIAINGHFWNEKDFQRVQALIQERDKSVTINWGHFDFKFPIKSCLDVYSSIGENEALLLTIKSLPKSIKYLDLSGNFFHIDFMFTLVEELKFTLNIQTLLLSNINLSPLRCMVLFEYVFQLTHLITLDLSDNPIGIKFLEFVMLKGSCKLVQLQRLSLRNTGITGRKLSKISCAFSKFPKLKYLDLSENRIADGFTELSCNLTRILSLEIVKIDSITKEKIPSKVERNSKIFFQTTKPSYDESVKKDPQIVLKYPSDYDESKGKKIYEKNIDNFQGFHQNLRKHVSTNPGRIAENAVQEYSPLLGMYEPRCLNFEFLQSTSNSLQGCTLSIESVKKIGNNEITVFEGIEWRKKDLKVIPSKMSFNYHIPLLITPRDVIDGQMELKEISFSSQSFTRESIELLKQISTTDSIREAVKSITIETLTERHLTNAFLTLLHNFTNLTNLSIKFSCKANDPEFITTPFETIASLTVELVSFKGEYLAEPFKQFLFLFPNLSHLTVLSDVTQDFFTEIANSNKEIKELHLLKYSTSSNDRLLVEISELRLEKLSIIASFSPDQFHKPENVKFHYLRELHLAELLHFASFPDGMLRLNILTILNSSLLPKDFPHIGTKCVNLKKLDLFVTAQSMHYLMQSKFIIQAHQLYQLNVVFEKKTKVSVDDFARTFLIPSLVRFETNFVLKNLIFSLVNKKCKNIYQFGKFNRDDLDGNIAIRCANDFNLQVARYPIMSFSVMICMLFISIGAVIFLIISQ